MSLMLTKGLGPAAGGGGRTRVYHFNPAKVVVRKKGAVGTKLRSWPQLAATVTQRLPVLVQPIAQRQVIVVKLKRKTVTTRIR